MFTFAVALAVAITVAAETPKPPLPQLPTVVERITDNAAVGVIHGWHSNHLLKYNGVLYADGRVDDPAANNENAIGASPGYAWTWGSGFFRRLPGGQWEKVCSSLESSYLSLMAPDGRMWDIAPSSFDMAEVIRMKNPLDFSTFEVVYAGSCSYMGASMSPEGNFLMLHAESKDIEAFRPNAIISAFYDQSTGKWHKQRFVTPEGRYGYIGILLKGKRALAVLNSAISDPKANPDPPHYSWRHVRLAKCDDLTTDKWENRGFLMPEFGATSLMDFIEGPDGNAYLAYSHGAANTLEEWRKTPTHHYIARIKPDLSAEIFPTTLEAGATRILLDSKGGWYVLGRASDSELHLWAIDPSNGFKPTREWVLPGTKKLEGYVIHPLRPERFGGEADGDTIHVMSARYVDENGLPLTSDKRPHHSELWYAQFRLPVE